MFCFGVTEFPGGEDDGGVKKTRDGQCASYACWASSNDEDINRGFCGCDLGRHVWSVFRTTVNCLLVILFVCFVEYLCFCFEVEERIFERRSERGQTGVRLLAYSLLIYIHSMDTLDGDFSGSLS